ncbi:MAG: Rrf2 family transcriptional regulator [Candidatus Omnitrophica bacterium]|nr:Rrf2 family transcriptional regulator [Candidatus Omnitrophota bacterium]
MLFSKKTEYALQALLALASASRDQPAGSLTLKKMAEMKKIPYKFLEQIMAALKKGGLVSSQKGQKGGYALSRTPAEVTVGEVVTVVEGPVSIRQSSRAAADKEVIYRFYDQLSQTIAGVLRENTLENLYVQSVELAERRRAAEMYYI